MRRYSEKDPEDDSLILYDLTANEQIVLYRADGNLLTDGDGTIYKQIAPGRLLLIDRGEIHYVVEDT